MPKATIHVYGPSVGEFSHDQLFGPYGNRLRVGDVALSPDLLARYPLGTPITINGKKYTVADVSFISPGRPNHNTVEIWNGHPSIAGSHAEITPAPIRSSASNFLDEASKSNLDLMTFEGPADFHLPDNLFDPLALSNNLNLDSSINWGDPLHSVDESARPLTPADLADASSTSFYQPLLESGHLETPFADLSGATPAGVLRNPAPNENVRPNFIDNFVNNSIVNNSALGPRGIGGIGPAAVTYPNPATNENVAANAIDTFSGYYDNPAPDENVSPTPIDTLSNYYDENPAPDENVSPTPIDTLSDYTDENPGFDENVQPDFIDTLSNYVPTVGAGRVSPVNIAYPEPDPGNPAARLALGSAALSGAGAGVSPAMPTAGEIYAALASAGFSTGPMVSTGPSWLGGGGFNSLLTGGANRFTAI